MRYGRRMPDTFTLEHTSIAYQSLAASFIHKNHHTINHAIGVTLGVRLGFRKLDTDLQFIVEIVHHIVYRERDRLPKYTMV